MPILTSSCIYIVFWEPPNGSNTFLLPGLHPGGFITYIISLRNSIPISHSKSHSKSNTNFTCSGFILCLLWSPLLIPLFRNPNVFTARSIQLFLFLMCHFCFFLKKGLVLVLCLARGWRFVIQWVGTQILKLNQLQFRVICVSWSNLPDIYESQFNNKLENITIKLSWK